MTDRKATILGSLALFLSALVWGASFIFQKTSIQHISPLVFNGVRFFMGAAALTPFVAMSDYFGGHRRPSLWGEATTPARRNFLLWGGVFSGLLLGIASMTQHIGMIFTTAGKAAFITALYILLVPLLGLLRGRKVHPVIWGCVLLAVFGSYLLCGKMDKGINWGDVICFGCALGFALQIIVTGRYAPHVDCLRLSVVEFIVAGALSCLVALICGKSFSLAAMRNALVALLYCGLFSSGVGYTFQNIGEKYVNPVAASLLMSLESVFAVFFGLLIGERMTLREIGGCCAIFTAIIVAQLASSHKTE